MNAESNSKTKANCFEKLALPPFALTDGTVEALKWLALILMTGDHINKYLLNGTNDVLFQAGRLCLPIFVCVLAYNLSRPSSFGGGVYIRTMMRLSLFGAIASVPFIALGSLINGWWPLNILFTLLAITTLIYFVERHFAECSNRTVNILSAILVFLFGGSIVEYWWPAIVLGLAVWSYCRHPSLVAGLAAFIALLALWVINKNFWAMAALPLLIIATKVDVPVPRLRWFFYAFYPCHLSVLWLLRIPMRDAGYLFF